jgi:phosphopantothenoylcysteine decarboxylase/phosphopantothenate--cysteine ligase
MVDSGILQGKRVVLGVTGSIAAYKAVDLASKLTQAGVVVDVIMTESAQRFVTQLAFQSVTGRPVYTNLWASADTGDGLPTHIAHVGLGEGADLLAIVPCTANTLAKMAHGLADDLLSVTALAARCPLLIAPAMDGGMYAHPATQHAITTLTERGAYLVEPERGRFASGLEGIGRLPETLTLLGAMRQALGHAGILSRKHVLVTAGGTQEALDPVRFITNRSSGKQGYAIAQAVLDAGGRVTLISSAALPAPYGATVIPVESAQEMQQQVLRHIGQVDALIMAAAVADFRPTVNADQKIKKSDSDAGLTLELVANPDILASVKESAERPRVVVGFAAESHDLVQHAEAKLERKGLDFILANDITRSDAGFSVDTNEVVVIARGGEVQRYPLMSKAAVADMIVGRVAGLLKS